MVCMYLQIVFEREGVFIHTTIARADEDALVPGRIFIKTKVCNILETFNNAVHSQSSL